MTLPDFSPRHPSRTSGRVRFVRLLGAPAFAVLHKRATDPRSQHLTIAWWAQAVLCDST